MAVVKFRLNNGRYIRQIAIQIIFCGLLVIFWIVVISLSYIAICCPQDFVSIKPLKPEQYPFSYKINKSIKCEHYEVFADFRSDKLLQNIWITLIWSILGVMVSISTLYGVLMESSYYLDLGAFYLFIYAIHKAFIAGILFLIKCPGTFLFEFFILTEPSVVFLSILDISFSLKTIHLILMTLSFCLLMLVTSFRNQLNRKEIFFISGH